MLVVSYVYLVSGSTPVLITVSGKRWGAQLFSMMVLGEAALGCDYLVGPIGLYTRHGEQSLNLFIDPVLGDGLVGGQFATVEPEGDLPLGRLDRVGPWGAKRAVRDGTLGPLQDIPMKHAPWMMLRPTSSPKSPRMVPGAEARGLVAPIMARPVLTIPLPSKTMATTGPLDKKLTSLSKNGLPWCSA